MSEDLFRLFLDLQARMSRLESAIKDMGCKIDDQCKAALHHKKEQDLQDEELNLLHKKTEEQKKISKSTK